MQAQEARAEARERKRGLVPPPLSQTQTQNHLVGFAVAVEVVVEALVALGDVAVLEPHPGGFAQSGAETFWASQEEGVGDCEGNRCSEEQGEEVDPKRTHNSWQSRGTLQNAGLK